MHKSVVNFVNLLLNVLDDSLIRFMKISNNQEKVWGFILGGLFSEIIIFL